jgi:hypothetical protein
MQSQHFEHFGIPIAECEIEPAFHPDFPIPYLFFRSSGNPLVGLDLNGATKLQQLMAHAGEVENAQEIQRQIAKARQLQ